MDKKRDVHKIVTVFDILNYRSILAPYKSRIRVLFEYDAVSKKEDFTILTRDMPEYTQECLVEMLKQNVPRDKIINGLVSNNLDYSECMAAA